MNIFFSRAICKYLVEKYGSATGAYSKEQLYPKDLQKRATIDHRIDFDLGALYRRASDYFVSIRIIFIITTVQHDNLYYNKFITKINDFFLLNTTELT